MSRLSRSDRTFPWPLVLTGLAVLLGTALFPVSEDGETRWLFQVARERVLGRGDAVYSGLPKGADPSGTEPHAAPSDS